jgi:hypothetical protein
MFAGGGQSSQRGAAIDEKSILNPLGQLPLVKEKITLTMGMVRSTISPDIVDNYKTITLEKDSNIHLEFVFYGSSGSEAQQKLELEIMAGGTELPDIINFGLEPLAQGFYGSQGMLIPLENYINNSAYWMKDGVKEMAFDPWKFIRSADGHIYSLFNYSGEFVTEIVARMSFDHPEVAKAGGKPEIGDNIRFKFRIHSFLPAVRLPGQFSVKGKSALANANRKAAKNTGLSKPGSAPLIRLFMILKIKLWFPKSIGRPDENLEKISSQRQGEGKPEYAERYVPFGPQFQACTVPGPSIACCAQNRNTPEK